MPISGPPLDRPAPLATVLETGLRANADEAALVSLEREWSWRELDKASTQLATRYLAAGLKPGDRVASLLPNRGALFVHYIACFKAGLTATPLNYRYQAPEIDHALEVSGASILVAHAERTADLAKSEFASKLRLGRISYGSENGAGPHLEEMMTSDARPADLPLPDPATPAFIYFTSGSTGKPKGVTHTHSTFGWVMAVAIAGLDLTAKDVFLPATSASHVAASSLGLSGLAAGCRIAIARAFDGHELLPLMRNTRPSLLCMLPAPLFGLVRDHGAAHDDFKSIRRCVAGGDKISSELEREFTGLTGFAIEELYGMTETGTSTFNPHGAGNRVGSIGKVAPGFTASIRDDAGNEVPTGTPGRMWMKSNANMIGYWNRPDATAETIIDGWLDTGDLVSADDEGYLWFRGRKKQIIIHDGSNICPQEVEESLLEHSAVANVGVIGIHNLIHGEIVRAYIELKPEAPRPSAAELMAFSKERVGYKAPEEIVILDEMPINATGKVDRVTLKQLAEDAANTHLAS